ncbi:hypothetical protein ACOSQ2_004573 [Xanthoceras sorbifolium]
MVVFSKILSKTDLSKLHVPIIAENHFNFQQQDGIQFVNLRVMGPSDDVQELSLRKKQKQVKGRPYSELVITKGWPNFVKSRGIEEGDKVIFRRRRDDDVGELYICEVVKKFASSSSNAGSEGMHDDVYMEDDDPVLVDNGMSSWGSSYIVCQQCFEHTENCRCSFQ